MKDVIKAYMKAGLSNNAAYAEFETDPAKPGQFRSAAILHGDGSSLSTDFSCDEPITIRIVYEVRQVVAGTYLTFYLQNMEGTRVLFSDIRDMNPDIGERLGVGSPHLHGYDPAQASGAYDLLADDRQRGQVCRCPRPSARLLRIHPPRPGYSKPVPARVLGIQLPWHRSEMQDKDTEARKEPTTIGE